MTQLRWLRSHDCRCGFRNEFDIGIRNESDGIPAVFDSIEQCPRCAHPVSLTRVFPLPVRPVDMSLRSGG